jgi:serine/threonine-protein kinase
VTAPGVILGTAAYMSPEQAKGGTSDKRGDIWSFGCVLYEMLSGKRAFDGHAIADVLEAVLRSEPDWSVLPADTPRSIRSLLERCLLKDRRRRIADMSVVLYLLGDASRDSSTTPDHAVAAVRLQRTRVKTGVLGFAAGTLAAAVLAWSLFGTRATEALRPVHFEFVTPAAQPLSPNRVGLDNIDFAVSPDGTRIVYRAGDGPQARLVLRPLNDLQPRPLPGTTGASSGAFFSPDGQSIGFFSSGRLRKIAVAGGTAIEVCPIGATERGATWGPDDTIIYATAERATGLLRVSGAGGPPTVLTTPDAAHGELDHWFPEFLPGNRGVLFTIIREQPEQNDIAVFDLQTGQRRILIRGGSQAEYINSGYLAYAAGGGLRAVRFDLATLKVLSDPVPVVDRVATTSDGVGQFAASPVGTLVYMSSETRAQAEPERSLVWVDRQGRERSIGAPRRAFTAARLSPDGTHLALDIGVADPSIWIWDMRRETLTPLNGAPGSRRQAVWTPDGSRIIFRSERGGSPNLYWQAADGSGIAEALFPTPQPQLPYSVSPDGTRVFLAQLSPPTRADVGVLILEGQRRTELLVQTAAQEFSAEVSPDGRWLAYQSNESGGYEVYVRPLPYVNKGRWQISTNGGSRPAWARNGRELFYFDPDNRLTAVSIQGDATTLIAGKPTTLLEAAYVAADGSYERPYDVAADGRFLMIKDDLSAGDRAAGTTLVVIANWLEELKRLHPSP